MPKLGAASEMLLERDDVLAAIAGAAARAADGHGTTLLVQGAPGLGKTTVLRAARDTVLADAGLVCTARGGELEQQMPWAIARALLRGPAMRSPQLVGPAAGAVLGLGDGHPSDEVAALFDLTELCLALAAERPLVLVIDDVHWADRSSARFLTYLAARIAEVPVVALLAGRPADPRRPPELVTLAGRDDVTLLDLEPLSREAAARLVAARLPGAGPDVVDALYRATAGNLFLLIELARELQARGGPITAAAVDDAQVGTVDRALQRRLAAAGDEAGRLARAVAILGQGAQLSDAAAIAALPYAAAAGAADALRAAGLLATATEEEPGLAFLHPLLLTAMRRSVPPGELSLLHLAAARQLDRAGASLDRVGALLRATEPGDDPWVRERLVAAADVASAAGAPASAVALLQRAVAERVNGQDPVLLAKLGRAALDVDPALAEGPLRAALRLTPDPADRVDLSLTLSIALQMLRRSGEATDHLLELEAELIAAGASRRDRLRVVAEALAQSFFDPRTRALRAERLPGLVAGLDGSDEEELLIHVQRAVAAINTGTAEEVRELADLAWAGGRLARLAGAPETPTVMWIPYLRLYTDDAAWTAALMEDWLQQARERGSTILASFAHALLAQARLRSGELRDAEAAADSAWGLARELGPAFPAWWIAIATLAEIQVATGDATAARSLLAGAGLLDGPPPDVMLMPAPRVARAQTLLAGGEVERATAELMDAWDWIEHEDTISPGGWWFPAALVDALLVAGRTTEALRIARAWLDRTERFGARSTLGQAQRAVGLAIGGEEALEWLERAEATLAASPARHEHARALLELGAARRRLRRPTEAREPLRAALDLATRCGAGALAERARVELIAAGGRPRRAALNGGDALTASERRVAMLAGEGRTNREIANTLFISRKTVERHLTHIYLKLGSNDRTRITALLAGDDTVRRS